MQLSRGGGRDRVTSPMPGIRLSPKPKTQTPLALPGGLTEQQAARGRDERHHHHVPVWDRWEEEEGGKPWEGEGAQGGAAETGRQACELEGTPGLGSKDCTAGAIKPNSPCQPALIVGLQRGRKGRDEGRVQVGGRRAGGWGRGVARQWRRSARAGSATVAVWGVLGGTGTGRPPLPLHHAFCRALPLQPSPTPPPSTHHIERRGAGQHNAAARHGAKSLPLLVGAPSGAGKCSLWARGCRERRTR